MTLQRSDRSTLCIFGAGGHGREIAWLAQEVLPTRNVVFLVDPPYATDAEVNGIPVIAVADADSRHGDSFIVGVGATSDRQRLAEALGRGGMYPETLVHPRAEVATTATIGAGSLVSASSVVSTNVTIGKHSHINIGSTISHDVTIEDFVTISPGVHVAGYVTIQRGAYIGAGATIINGTPSEPLVVGAWAKVAAGACVVRSVPHHSLVMGVPAVARAE